MAVVGGGISGLTFSLLAARAGHDVVVIDGDPPRSGDVEAAWQHWDRRSVPQFRQIHGFQAVAHAMLQEHLPDVLTRLHAAGARDASRIPAVPGADAIPGSDALVQFQCRRSTLEWVLRSAAADQHGIDLREGHRAEGLITHTGSAPAVVGVRTTAGDLTADLVVDAAGRRSGSASWCADAGLPAAERESVDTGQVYFTRWFRERAANPSLPYTRVELSFASLLIYPADAGWLSATFFAPAGDAALRSMLLDPDRLVAAARAVPTAGDILDADLVEPHGDVLFMGRLKNHLTRPSAAGVVRGLVSLADVVVGTNPTWGRGVALAMANAASLAQLVGELEPADLSREFTDLAVAQLEPWYHDTVFLDREVNALWSGADPTVRHSSLSLADALAAARVDPVVAVRYARYRNLLDPPWSFWGDADMINRVRTAIDEGAPPVTVGSPSRSDLAALL